MIGTNAGGGCAGGAYEGGPDDENGLLLAVPGATGEGSIGRVSGNTDADHRCGCPRGTRMAGAAGPVSPTWRSVIGRSSREDVARCKTPRDAVPGG